MKEESYSIAELAERGGVSRRTVRYYVQRELLPAPTGVGRGRHYDRRHLEQLIRVRDLQSQGVPLAEIARRLRGEPEAPPPPSAHQSIWSRITVAEGVELHLREARLDAQQVQELRDAVARILEKGRA